MPDSSLIQYIKQTRERNVPDEVAKEKLLQAGWSYELVVEAFNYLNHKDDHIKILSKKNLSKMTIFALAISFLIPPLGMVLAYIAMRRLKNDESKVGHEFLTASFVVGVIGTLSISFILLNSMGYTTGLSNMTGYFTNECFFSKNFKCIEDAKIVDKSVKIELRNDIDSQIEIHDVELDCGKSKLTKIYPGNLVNPKERFVLNILCENDIYETMKINYTDKSTGENILFEGKV